MEKINFRQLANKVVNDLTKSTTTDTKQNVAVVEFDKWSVQFEYSENTETLYWFAETHDGENLNVDNHVLMGNEYLTNFPLTITMIAYIIESIYNLMEAKYDKQLFCCNYKT
jgi:hypothetical protein